jgi:2-polyprenyl-6-methoxyphenol hydroxylase-like FAD-dependent oxidoreductase
MARLKRWGLLDKIARSNCAPMRRMTLDVGDFALVGSPPPADGVAESYAPRRTVLDKALVDAAVGAGAELRAAFSVTEVVTDGERVTGIRGRARGGSEVTEQARLIIGADGVHSIVAGVVAAPEYDAKPTRACWYYTYWSGVAADGPEIGAPPARGGTGRVRVAAA